MEKRSRRRIRDLVARPASLGLSENEIGCARISMMARNTNVPFKGRIQKRKTYHLQIITFRLQRAAGPYRCATQGHQAWARRAQAGACSPRSRTKTRERAVPYLVRWAAATATAATAATDCSCCSPAGSVKKHCDAMPGM